MEEKCSSYFEAEILGCASQRVILQSGTGFIQSSFLRLCGTVMFLFLSFPRLVTPCLLAPCSVVDLRDMQRSEMTVKINLATHITPLKKKKKMSMDCEAPRLLSHGEIF